MCCCALARSALHLLHVGTPEICGKAIKLMNGFAPKVLNSSEDAHLESMSTFEADEHLLATVLWLRSDFAVDIEGALAPA